jgi:hypothetical protein
VKEGNAVIWKLVYSRVIVPGGTVCGWMKEDILRLSVDQVDDKNQS